MKKATKKQTKTLTIDVLDKKGDVIHSIRDLSQKDVTKMRRDFYRILVFKMKQKVSFKIRAA